MVEIDEFPLTPNGKLDRKALPAPSYVTDIAGRAPRTPQEEILCGLFAEVLGLERVGIDDGFFDLGGHSLLATQLIAKVRAVLGVEVGIRDFFRNSTAAGLADVLDTAPVGRPALRAFGRPAVLAPSALQRRLWFLSRTSQGFEYNVPLALRLRGTLAIEALRAALADVVARHEVLRTTFPEHEGEPRQFIHRHDACVPELRVVDCDPGELAGAVASFARIGFDLSDDQPLRAVVHRTAADDHTLTIVVHHIATDGWSTGVLLRDLARAYNARVADTSPTFTPLPVQYADYAQWHAEILGDEQDADTLISRQLAFWKSELSGIPTELALPYDRPRPSVSSNGGGTVPVAIDEELHTLLLRLAREHGCTIFMVLQAALAGLLARLGSGEDVPIGTPAAGRTEESLNDLVGFFINTLVLRTDLTDDPTFGELLARVRETDLAAYENQQVPFDRVVDALRPERSPARHPLFQVMLQIEQSTIADLELSGLTVTNEPVDFTAAKFDLRLDLVELHDSSGAPAGMTGVLEYSTDLFEHGTAESISSRFLRLLQRWAATPQRRLSAVDVLSAEERRRLLTDWNDTETEVPTQLVPDLFEEFAARTPQKLAVVASDGGLTYSQLNIRANRLARYLMDLGAEPERLIAVALPSTVDLVVALLAILKSGAGYLPLDPSQPVERLRKMVGSARPLVIVTTADLVHRLPEVPHLVLDDAATGASVRLQRDSNVTHTERPSALTPRTPAYVIYTSGSTGEPKGVVIEHRSLALYLAWARQAYTSMQGRALVHSPVAFDLTVTGIWGPLTSGGEVHLVALDDQGTAPVSKPTFVKATPSHLALFGALPDEYAPSGQLVLGGELLLGAALDEWRARHPGVTVVNEYGPTETTVGCAEFRIAPGDPVPTGGVTIGRPIWNTQWYVLDAGLSPVPAGVVGELYIGGGLLARGYLDRPDLTSARFVASPFGRPGERMYRTGDLVRWREDGLVEFVGRVDDQVKVRGFRVELAEVEALISVRPEVAAAAATVFDGASLVAYAVAADGAQIDVSAVRERLRNVLPEYMQPSAVVVLDRLPLTKNGKLDRAALPRPQLQPGEVRRAPRTNREYSLCALFGEVLGLREIGVDDSFFDLGGHSLLAFKLVNRAKTELGLRISVQDLFTAPTVSALVGLLNRDENSESFTGMLELNAGSNLSPLFCVHPGAGIGWVYSALLDHLDDSQPVYALQARSVQYPGTVPASVEEMAKDYVGQVRAVNPDGPYRLLGWSFGAIVAHAMAAQLQSEGAEVELLVMLDGYPSDATSEHEPTQAAALRELLASLGHDFGTDQGESLAIADFIRLAGAGDGPLAGLDQATISAIAETFVGHARLRSAHTPPIFRGDVLFFSAVLDGGIGATAEQWRPYVTGSLEHHEVPFAHGDMMKSQSAAQIGAVIARKLRRAHT
ncbi:amino acid adenylation domain-containing protein [Streptomyces sp. Ncost-T6T-1]|uniref:amino acid adenylation domain-containing protein n=1 Tax=Streptomyces sp. Ncost-T6T-1 TaxID=1100828 RepID=UPI00159ED7CE|nr:non-ribosomal peptide synthetase [Streptomyces sp. Ncost-T6T-1]